MGVRLAMYKFTCRAHISLYVFAIFIYIIVVKLR